MSATEHTVDEALAKFDLIANSTGNEAEGMACAMSMLSWVAGEAWSDHPPCAHRLLADMAIKANDADGTTPEQREAIVRAGCEGIIDTWWVPAEVILLALAEAPADSEVVGRALSVFAAVAAWKSAEPKVRPDLRSANLHSANLHSANLRSADLRSADLRSANLHSANLHSANLRSANLRSADLRSANLYSANLYSADLHSANLSSANLYSADLHSANLSSANLYSANLHSANLRSADLRSANLRSANLRSANLSSADLRSANLSSADLRSAHLRSADLRSANLRSARGNAFTKLPEGWVVQESTGFVMLATEAEVAG